MHTVENYVERPEGAPINYTLFVPHAVDEPTSEGWPVKVAFPTVGDAMTLFALAAKGREQIRGERHAEHPLQQALVGAMREAVKQERLTMPAEEPILMPKYMRVLDYAAYRKVSKRSIETLIRQGLPLDGRGKMRRVPVEEADRWMRDRGHEQIDREASVTARRAAIKSVRGGGR